MKWFLWVIIAIALLVYGLARYAMSTALTTENPVGFETIQITDANGTSIAAGVWYPTQAQPKPTTLLTFTKVG